MKRLVALIVAAVLVTMLPVSVHAEDLEPKPWQEYDTYPDPELLEEFHRTYATGNNMLCVAFGKYPWASEPTRFVVAYCIGGEWLWTSAQYETGNWHIEHTGTDFVLMDVDGQVYSDNFYNGKKELWIGASGPQSDLKPWSGSGIQAVVYGTDSTFGVEFLDPRYLEFLPAVSPYGDTVLWETEDLYWGLGSWYQGKEYEVYLNGLVLRSRRPVPENGQIVIGPSEVPWQGVMSVSLRIYTSQEDAVGEVVHRASWLYESASPKVFVTEPADRFMLDWPSRYVSFKGYTENIQGQNRYWLEFRDSYSGRRQWIPLDAEGGFNFGWECEGNGNLEIWVIDDELQEERLAYQAVYRNRSFVSPVPEVPYDPGLPEGGGLGALLSSARDVVVTVWELFPPQIMTFMVAALGILFGIRILGR